MERSEKNFHAERHGDDLRDSGIDKLTWAVLLGRWTSFAQSSLALPADGVAGHLRHSVSDIITLQAVWFSLQHLQELDADEQALGRDRAAVLIDQSERAIRRRFGDEPLPDMLDELIQDARDALAESREG